MPVSFKSISQALLLTTGLVTSALAVNAQKTEFSTASRQRAQNNLKYPGHEKKTPHNRTDFVNYLPASIKPDALPTSTLILVADGTLPTSEGRANDASQSLLGLKNTLFGPAPLVPDLQQAFPGARAAHITGNDPREIAANISQALALANNATNNGITDIVLIDRYKSDPAHPGSVLSSNGHPFKVGMLYKALAKGTAGVLPSDAKINVITPRADGITIDAALAELPNATIAILPGRDLKPLQPNKTVHPRTADDFLNMYVLNSQNPHAMIATKDKRITQSSALDQIGKNRAALGKNFTLLAEDLRWVVPAPLKELVTAATRIEDAALCKPGQNPADADPVIDQLPGMASGAALLWSLQLTRNPAPDIGQQFNANGSEIKEPVNKSPPKPALTARRPGLSQPAGAEYTP